MMARSNSLSQFRFVHRNPGSLSTSNSPTLHRHSSSEAKSDSRHLKLYTLESSKRKKRFCFSTLKCSHPVRGDKILSPSPFFGLTSSHAFTRYCYCPALLPKFSSSSIPSIFSPRSSFMENLSVSYKELRKMLACLQHPARPLQKPPTAFRPSATNSGLLFREKLVYLESLCIDPHKALNLNPSLRSAPLSSILALETSLASYGLSRPSIGRILDMYPVLLTSDPLPPINFLLDEASLPLPQLPLSLSRCPRLLVSSVPSQLRPAHQFLTSLGLHIDSHTTLLLVSNVEKTLIPKIEYLESIGFRKEEVRRMVVRSPGLLTLSVENNMVPKVKYFLEEMKGELKELKQCPQYFSFSLERKIKPRHRALKEHGIKMPLSRMLKVSDGEFSDRLLDIRLRTETR